MVFLNPWFLLGLAAAAIPVLIHLLHLKKLRTVEFSSLRFLKELQRSRIRAIHLRQLLLLLLRTLLIIFLVLAFARPTVHGSFFGLLGGTVSRTTVILMDDSPSMTVRDDRGVRFEQARRAARRIAALTAEGDHVIFTGAVPLGVSPPSAAASKQAVEQAISGAAATVVHTPFAEALNRLRPVLAEAPRAEREIFVITDGQASQFALPRTPRSEEPDRLLRATVVQVGNGIPENTGIVGTDLESQVLAPNKPLRLRITLRHFGPTPRNDAFMSVYLDGIRVAQRSVDLPPGIPVTVTAEPFPKRSGWIGGYVQIEDDALDADNMRHFSVRIPDRVAILAVGETPADTEYPVLALTLRGDSSFARLFSVTTGPRSRLGAFDTRSCDVLLLCGLRSVTPAEAAAIARFTSGGGGVILFTPPDADAASFGEVLLPALGLPRTRSVRPPSADSVSRINGFVTFSSVDRDHPLLRDLLVRPDRNRSSPVAIESPHVTGVYPLPAAGSAQRIIGLSNGDAFLAEYPAGRGRLLWFGVDPGTRSSDLPLRGIYAPLLHRAVLYLAGRAEADHLLHAGEPVILTPPEGFEQTPSRLAVISPSGLDEQITPEPAGPHRRTAVATGPSMELGLYTLVDRAAVPARPTPLALAAVTLDTAECDLRTATEAELNRFWHSVGVDSAQTRRIAADGPLEEAILEARSGTELWRVFAGLALLCALLEMIVGRVTRSEVPDA